MKRKWVLAFLGAAAVIGLLQFAVFKARAYQDQKALDHELALAHAEGLPVTWQEYAAGIPSAKPEENAAPLYKSLSKLRVKRKDDPAQIDIALFQNTSASTLESARRAIAGQGAFVAAMDQAAKLPRCWFDRDWSKGPAVLMPEYADMKLGTKWIALRGSVAAANGDAASAIRDIDEVFVIARHAAEEGTLISFLVAEAMDSIGLRHLALWARSHPDHPEYLTAFKGHLKEWPIPDLAFANRGALLEMREVLTMSTTPEGRHELGLREDDVSPAEKVLPLMMSRPKADIKIAQGMRQVCEAYRLPPAQRIAKIDAAWKLVYPTLLAYPTGADVYMKLGSGGGDGDGVTDHGLVLADSIAKGRLQEYQALFVLLQRRSIPKSLALPQLLSPIDGKPARVEFDGKQISVSISSSDKDVQISPLKFPSDRELGRTSK